MDDRLTSLLEALGGQGGLPDDWSGFAACLVISILFGLALQYLYSLYFHDNEPQDGSLARSLVILTPTLAATFWMIQSSLVMSLGLLGSLSFVRFRTPVKRAEDVSFIVVGMAVSIACASANYAVGAALVLLLMAYTVIRNRMHARQRIQHKFAIITFNTTTAAEAGQITEALRELKVRPEFISSRTYDGITSYVFNAARVTDDCHSRITSRLTAVDRDAHINIFFPNDRLGA